MPGTRDAYPITDNIGYCIIFNIENYMTDNHELRRDGTKDDNKKIKETFKSFGYTVLAVQDPTENEIKKEMKTVLANYKDHKTASSFVCVILSHGTAKNEILTYDNKYMDLNRIIQMADTTDLEGIPKIFVIQACRGGNRDWGMYYRRPEEKGQSSIAFKGVMPLKNNPDFLLIFATPPGYVSFRNSKGTVFIQMLCEILRTNRDKAPVSALLQRLTLTLSCIAFLQEDKLALQIPYFASTLRKSLKLHKSDYQMRINTIKDCRLDNEWCRMVGLLQEKKGYDEKGVRVHLSKDSIYSKFLIEETSSCYDMSPAKERQCLVINMTTDKRAAQDCNNIQFNMQSMKFNVHISQYGELWEDTLKQCIGSNVIEIGCFFCFIQIDAEQVSSNNTLLTNIIAAVKKEGSLLMKPKIYIIQKYNVCGNDNTDCSNCTDPSVEFPVRYSTEADVLIIQVLAVPGEHASFINLFCKEYPDHARTVPLMDFLERVLPSIYERNDFYMQPTVCSTMRKHLLITDSFYDAKYQSEDLKNEEKLCDEIKNVADKIENKIKEENSSRTTTLPPVHKGDNADSTTEQNIKRHNATRLQDQETKWCNKDVWSGCFVIIVNVLLIILNLVKIVRDVKGYNNIENCNDTKSLPSTASLRCEHASRRMTLLALDLTSFITTVLVIICILVLLINGWKKCIYNSSQTKKSCLYRILGTLFFTFNSLMYTVEIVAIQKRIDYGFKDEAVVSICVAVLLFCEIFVMMTVTLFRCFIINN